MEQEQLNQHVINIATSLNEINRAANSGAVDKDHVDTHIQNVSNSIQEVVKQVVAETPKEHSEEAQPAVQQSPKLKDEGSTPSPKPEEVKVAELPKEAPKAETPKSPVVEAPKVASVVEAPVQSQGAGAGTNWTLIGGILAALVVGGYVLYRSGVLKQFGV